MNVYDHLIRKNDHMKLLDEEDEHRTLIGVEQPDGAVTYSRLPEHGVVVGTRLHRSYNTREKAEQLVELGDLRTLGLTLDECVPLNDPEAHQPPRQAPSALYYYSEHAHRYRAGFAFLFTDGRWEVQTPDWWQHEVTEEWLRAHDTRRPA